LLSVAEAHVSWQQEMVTARQGSVVSLTCIARHLDFLDVMRIELLASDGVLRTIADTATVKAPFSHIPRYVVTFDYRNSIGNLTVTYEGMLYVTRVCYSRVDLLSFYRYYPHLLEWISWIRGFL